MSDYFDSRKDCPVQRKAMGAYISSLLEDMLPPMRVAARACGYALATHGSLQRDIDIVAIPWTVQADTPDLLVERLCGVISGCLGRAIRLSEWSDKPHGRRAITIITTGDAEIDLSVMTPLEKEKK
jgi:hypothetical protein